MFEGMKIQNRATDTDLTSAGLKKSESGICGNSILVMQLLFHEVEGGSIPTSPLQMKLRPISYNSAIAFYSKWHYLGKTDFIASLNYGAFFEDRCVGVISYGTPNATDIKDLYDRNNQEGWFEIKRLAMEDACPKNSESRMIGISIQLIKKSNKKIKGIITYADAGVGHIGTIYKASGFTYLGLTAPKKDYLLDGKIKQRGKTKGESGEWIERSRKHLFVKKFI
jgi:hypothetical protein